MRIRTQHMRIHTSRRLGKIGPACNPFRGLLAQLTAGISSVVAKDYVLISLL